MSRRVRNFHIWMGLLFFIGTIAFLIWKQFTIPTFPGVVMMIAAYYVCTRIQEQMIQPNAHVATRSKNT